MLWRIILLFAGVVLATEPALACSCVRLSRNQVIERSEVAFTGVVRSVGTTRDIKQMVAVVNVTERIKGRSPKRVIVVTSNIPDLCGYPMQTGRSYGFAGTLEKRGRIGVSMCTMVPMNTAN